MTDSVEVEEMRRKVAEEYHRVMMDIFSAGYSDMKIIKNGREMVRRFSRNADKVIVWEDVEVNSDQVSERDGTATDSGI